MSAKYMGQVWELLLPFNKAWVLMALADHADHQGKKVFPSVPLVAWKTGYSLRQVRRIMSDLRDDKILVEEGRTFGGVKIYRLEFGHVLRKGDYIEPENGRPEGVPERAPRETPCQFVTGFCVTHNHQLPINESDGGEAQFDRPPGSSSSYRDTAQLFRNPEENDYFGDEP